MAVKAGHRSRKLREKTTVSPKVGETTAVSLKLGEEQAVSTGLSEGVAVELSQETKVPPGLSKDLAAIAPELREAATVTREKAHAIVVMPAYNAAATLRSTFEQIPPGIVEEIILVDDDSRDDTVTLARDLGLWVVAHPHNVGYGGNQKTCYMEALRRDAEVDVVVMLHPDGQYDPTILGDMIEAVRSGAGDIVLGSRFYTPGQAKAGGMPWWKRVANRFLTTCENLVLGLHLTEYHTGYRAYSRRFLRTVPFLRNSNDFVFDTQILVQAASFGFTIAEVPVSTRYFAEASSVNFKTSVVYGLKTVGVLLRYVLHRLGMKSRLFRR
jgi:glycosyltransferase involved in cell wall biosynthesis